MTGIQPCMRDFLVENNISVGWRKDYKALFVDQKLYIFGGKDVNNIAFSDFWVFHLSNKLIFSKSKGKNFR